MTKKGLYIHIPFCKSFCPYCKFPRLFCSPNNSLETKYIDFIVDKINKLDPNDFDTIYIGGGTPNSLDDFLLEKLLKSLSNFHPLEFTIELNPEFITPSQVHLIKKYNINRVSIGIQSFNNKSNLVLRRAYDFKDIDHKIRLLRLNKINNISLDLIFNYPGQLLKDFKTDIVKLLKLKPTHISAYDLIIEDQTPLAKLIVESKITPNTSDDSFIFYNYLIKKLKHSGYTHYEISSFAKKNYKGVHNLKYWNSDEYLAIGFGAISFLNKKEIINSSKLTSFYSDETNINYLDNKDLKQRFLLMGLRKVQGISITEYMSNFNSNPLNDFTSLKESIDDRLLVIKNDYLRLTKKGIFLANLVFEKLI